MLFPWQTIVSFEVGKSTVVHGDKSVSQLWSWGQVSVLHSSTNMNISSTLTKACDGAV